MDFRDEMSNSGYVKCRLERVSASRFANLRLSEHHHRAVAYIVAPKLEISST